MKKAHSFNIPKTPANALIVQEDHGSRFYDRLHLHEEIQLSCILEGRGKLLVADSVHSYSSGDIFVIGSQCPHVFRSDEEQGTSHMISIFFTRYSFGPEFFMIPEMQSLSAFFAASEQGIQLKSNKETIRKHCEQILSANRFDRFLLFLKLLKRISQSDQLPLCGLSYPKKISTTAGDRMGLIFDYVMHNFQQEITLADISEKAFMTPEAFCRFFKKRTNKTFFQFLIELRIEHACQLLASEGSLSISEIADNSGFRSISNFNRMFKKLKGLTPTAYSHNLRSRSL
ncbi:AraC family transcriptional regulator [Poritiphilus flavus]|uniref:Helix-turn-helix domain-containing protein n=1 Tax=Poritiphilus flavus TaxID=2697053 RepID=A0A6L9EDZ7_9FLAO|nr:AraC family transcriptional regulator [Poritiphilus flavus]NAS12984.1 helix-turn-helix domain-containing protein [Poritiphilus flavus]